MKTFDRWILTLLAVTNVILAGLRAARNRDPLVWVSFVTVSLALAVIVVASARLQNGFSEIGEQIDEKAMRRLQQNVYSLGFMANLGILSAIVFLH